MFSRNYIIVATSLILLSGCAKYSTVNSVEDIKVGKDNNIVFMGYDLTIPDTRIRNIRIFCSHKNIENKIKNKVCFSIQAKKGKTTYKGVETEKLEFGEYKVISIGYEVVTAFKKTKRGKSISYSETTDYFLIKSSVDIEFNVSRETSPYVGRLYIDVDHENIGILFKKKKKSILSDSSKSKITDLSRYLRLKLAQKYQEDLLLTKYKLALDSHINSPSDRHKINDTYKNNINCVVEDNFLIGSYSSNCKINVVKKIARGILTKEYSFSFYSLKPSY